jgi:hypothetical protein
MKTLILIPLNVAVLVTVLIGSASALAASPYDVCNELYSSADKIHCMEVVKNHQFDPNVTALCDSLYSSTDKINCLATIADKTYLPDELKICDGLYSSQDKLTCLAKAGSSVYCPTIAASKGFVAQIIGSMNAGNYLDAYNTASNFLGRLQTCN